jgi:hypothetical protein
VGGLVAPWSFRFAMTRALSMVWCNGSLNISEKESESLESVEESLWKKSIRLVVASATSFMPPDEDRAFVLLISASGSLRDKGTREFIKCESPVP